PDRVDLRGASEACISNRGQACNGRDWVRTQVLLELVVDGFQKADDGVLVVVKPMILKGIRKDVGVAVLGYVPNGQDQALLRYRHARSSAAELTDRRSPKQPCAWEDPPTGASELVLDEPDDEPLPIGLRTASCARLTCGHLPPVTGDVLRTTGRTPSLIVCG